MAAKSIMVTGTMSSAGKSFVTAGLCRIFAQDGRRTAPFKSQNMALNSYITRDGLEMGRAQVVQAEAAGLEPDVRMNPILLKPTSDKGSQVIVNGEIYGTMTATEYYQKKAELVPHIMEAYRSLASEYDVIVLEGAGSPAEINLKDVDIVNMGMAKLSDSPVILVGDIDRGGVFASIYGTIQLMDEEERHRIRGVIINKFRGDIDILKPGLDMLEKLTGVPVLGVLPYANIDLEEEDSLAEQLTEREKSKDAKLDFVVIRLPHISNFTDFDVFQLFSEVSVRYVTNRQELGNPDVVFLPGTKNTMEDLRWMRQIGLETEILKRHEKGTLVFGICGGFQMLGQSLADPDGSEEGGSMRGIGLLDTYTVFLSQKRRTRTRGMICSKCGVLKAMEMHPVCGYEIHMGKTTGGEKAVAFTNLENGEIDGYTNIDGTVYGTYLHGFFDGTDMAKDFIQQLLAQKGEEVEQLETISIESYKLQQYDRLADLLRKHLQMGQIYAILDEWRKQP